MSGYAATPDQRPARERGLIALGADSCPDRQGDGLVELRAAAIGLPAGGTHVDDLDAARAEHRQLITAIEVSQHGVSVARFGARIGVVNQLWDDDPAEVWAAAERLTRSGLRRQQVLEQLARVWTTHGPDDPAVLGTGRLPAGPRRDAYVAAVARLGPAATGPTAR